MSRDVLIGLGVGSLQRIGYHLRNKDAMTLNRCAPFNLIVVRSTLFFVSPTTKLVCSKGRERSELGASHTPRNGTCQSDTGPLHERLDIAGLNDHKGKGHRADESTALQP